MYAYEMTGQFEEAINARREMGLAPELIAALRTGLAQAGRQGYWSASRDYRLRTPQADSGALAAAYAQLGQHREALALMEQAFEEREAWLVNLNVFPYWDSLRDDPRFKDLVRRVLQTPQQ